ncbi:M23 family metallopeptidase [Pseudactinotalea sp. Z1732]|uniref:M23 family metallopeptidase n=1 Tax=Micrococcales TaxID=85006 RepID=UPI003C7D594B
MGVRTIAAGAGAVALVALALTTPWSGLTPAAPEAVPGPAAGGESQTTRAGPASEAHPVLEYRWPVPPPPRVLRHFEPPAQVWSPGHRGLDLSAGVGAPVHAAAAGVVAFAGPVADRTVVSIDHPDGIRTTYEPLDPLVRAGQQVHAGQVIGHVGVGEAGAHCVESCLHWGARTGPDTYLDPLLLVGSAPVTIRLYPLPG